MRVRAERMAAHREAKVITAEAVRRERESLGWSVPDLAYYARLSADTVRAIEAGKSDPTLSTLWALARAMGVSVSRLLGEEAEVDGLAADIAALPPHRREAVRDYARYQRLLEHGWRPHRPAASS